MVSKTVLLSCSGLVVLAVILVLVLLLAEDAMPELDEVVVNTTLGAVKGTFFFTRLHKEFMGFRGIRYAEPPVDGLRFAVRKFSYLSSNCLISFCLSLRYQ
jgi:Carboxylesterase family